MMRVIALFWVVTTWTFSTVESTDYVTYIPGDLPLLLTVSHGGNLKPRHIPARTIAPGSRTRRGCYDSRRRECVYDHRYDLPNCPGDNGRRCKVSYLRDSFTREIAVGVADAIHKITGQRPYLVINEVSREYVDPNREREEATFMNRQAIDIYNKFNSYIGQARTSIQQKGYGLLIDLHGQTHSEDWTEVGCTVSKMAYNTLHNYGTQIYPTDSTIRGLVSRTCGNSRNCFYEILKGRRSLGYFITQERSTKGVPYRAVPSPTFPAPQSGGYFSGGRITKTYGSKGNYHAKIDSLQVEMPPSVRRYKEERDNYIPALARAMMQFMHVNYHI